MNSPLLAESQISPIRCHVCGGIERSNEPFLPVLSADPGCVHWLHTQCHDEHARRIEEKVNGTMMAAGYGCETEIDATAVTPKPRQYAHAREAVALRRVG